MLVGQELLNKARSLSKCSEDEIAKGCGYVGPSGRVLRKSFYRALVQAKGIKLRSNGPGGQGIGLQEGAKLNSGQKFMGMATCLLDMPIRKSLVSNLGKSLESTYEKIQEQYACYL